MQISAVSISQRFTLFAACSEGKTIQHLPGAGGNCATFKCEWPDFRVLGDLLWRTERESVLHSVLLSRCFSNINLSNSPVDKVKYESCYPFFTEGSIHIVVVSLKSVIRVWGDLTLSAWLFSCFSLFCCELDSHTESRYTSPPHPRCKKANW